jgi:preprotein translocase subunit SecG
MFCFIIKFGFGAYSGFFIVSDEGRFGSARYLEKVIVFLGVIYFLICFAFMSHSLLGWKNADYA